MLDITLASGEEVVDTDDLITALEQLLTKMRTEETSATSNKI